MRLSDDLPHPVTSLDALQASYRTLTASNPDNYAWFQAQFERRAEQVYAAIGLDFPRRLRAPFRPGGRR